jgi:hypothetical protein
MPVALPGMRKVGKAQPSQSNELEWREPSLQANAPHSHVGSGDCLCRWRGDCERPGWSSRGVSWVLSTAMSTCNERVWLRCVLTAPPTFRALLVCNLTSIPELSLVTLEPIKRARL